MATTFPYSTAVLGVPFHNITIDEAVIYIEEKIEEGGFHQIATANVDFLMHSIRDKGLQEILCSCDLVVPDGMPILWAAKLLGASLKERVCGVDLVPRLANLCAQRGFSMFLLGASEASSSRAADNLKKTFPGLRIAGRYSPPARPLEQMDHEEILHRIAIAKPDILLVAFGNPKQEKWIAMNRERLNVPVCIGVGGSIDFIAGAVPRAPQWMQNAGFEWLYRASQEPKRLAKRYLQDAIGFAWHMPSYFLTTVLQPRHKTRPGVFLDRVETTDVVSVYGDFTGSTVKEFQALTESSIANGMSLVLNLAETNYMGADALGLMIQISAAMRESHRELWLAEMRPHLLRVLHSAHLNLYFRITSSVDDAIHRAERAEQQYYMRSNATRGRNRVQSNTVQVRFEFLQDICQKIAVNPPAIHRSGLPTSTNYALRTSL
jgi:N-acetylglucosaminyldiphosphoundecaprenol N-acetyl-beta-D-mannosaminyltransferase